MPKKHTEKLPKALIQEEQVSLSGLLDDSGLTTYEDTSREGFVLGSFNSLARLIGIFIISGIAAALLSLVMLVPLASSASTIEPMVSWYKSLPEELPEASIAERNVIYDANGDEITEFWVEDRIQLESLDEISDYAVDALIATEDRRFFEHTGFDPRGIGRALVSGEGGGSGITQQLVKNLQFYDRSSSEEERFDAIDISIERKIQELRYSIAYEENHSKEEILLEYFNIVSFGGPNTYSIESASQYFFGKSAEDLELHEASVLVGSVQNTSLFDLQDPEAEEQYKNRQAAVLDSMADVGYITDEEASEAFERDLEIQENPRSGGCQESDHPFFCEYVIDYLRDDPSLGEDEEERNGIIAAGGLQIQTTLDPEINDTLQEVSMDALGSENRVTLPITVVEPGTGHVLGFGFNREYGDGEGETEINLADSPTGTGSTFKMFTLAAAFESGFSPEQLNYNPPCPWQKEGWETPDGGIGNSTGCSDFQTGPMGFLEGTAVSSNTYFAEMQSQVGMEAVSDFATSVGMEPSPGSRSSSYTLGPQENSPIDVAAAFATFSADGVYCPATPVTDVHYEDGTAPRVPDSYDPESQGCEGVMSPQNAGMVLEAMQANMSDEVHPNALGQDSAISGYDAVGKSGTNQLYNQAWAMISDQFSLYANAYDFEMPSREIDNYFSDGEVRPWDDNTAQRVGARAMEEILEPYDNVPLNYESSETEPIEITDEQRDMVTVPSVIGMDPEASLTAFEGSGLTAHIEKERCLPDEEYTNRFPPGVIVGQSVDPGETLPRGTETEVVLCANR